MPKSAQLLLQLSLEPRYRFANFIAHQQPTVASWSMVDVLSNFVKSSSEQQCYIYAQKHFGKTHLLQALCRYVNMAPTANKALYCPLKSWVKHDVAILNQLDNYFLLALDDVDAIAGNRQWETALFNLINRARARRSKLVFSASNTPSGLAIQLADLSSRLNWGQVIEIPDFDDDNKIKWLQQTALGMGFKLDKNLAAYIIKHLSRDRGKMLQLLEQANVLSLQQQRKITLPLLKQAQTEIGA